MSMRGIFILGVLGLGGVAFGCSDGGDGAGGGGTGGSGQGGGTQGQTIEVNADIAADATWTSDNIYVLNGPIHVVPGATLTIEPGTVIQGDKASQGSLIVSRGARLMAEGEKDAPIVFTSKLPAGDRAPGDWGGVVILGNAPINEAGGEADIEGFTTAETYGGTDAADSSGSLRYVRIEFGGIEIAADNEINGLTLGGVGSGTTIDYVMVRSTLDDCFEFFGGTVNASHLVCYRNQDDGFDFDQGYVGNLQFLFLAQDPNIADEANGLECDNDKDDPTALPRTNPTIYNVTLCGQNAAVASQQYGMLFRRGFQATIGNAYVTGFEAAVDFRDVPPTDVSLTSSVFAANSPENVAYAEDGSNEEEQADDDAGFDERAWFTGGVGNTSDAAELAGCFGATPDPRPAQTIPGATPPSGLQVDATYVGAFRDASDDWMTGAWVEFSQN